MTQTLRVLVVSKYRVSAEALSSGLTALGSRYQIETTLCCNTQRPDFDPEVVIVLCLAECPAGPHAITTAYPRAKVLMIARSPSMPEQAVWVEAGIMGILDESDEKCGVGQVAAAVAAVQSGKLWVPRRLLLHMVKNEGAGQSAEDENQPTRRETKILSLLHMGMSNGDIARLLHISEKTVKGHLTSLYRKLGVDNRAQAVLRTRDLRCVECGGTLPTGDSTERPPTARQAS